MRDDSVELRHVLTYKDNPDLKVVPILHVIRGVHPYKISDDPSDYMSAIVMPELVTLCVWARRASVSDVQIVVCELLEVSSLRCFKSELPVCSAGAGTDAAIITNASGLETWSL